MMRYYSITVRIPGCEPEQRTATINGRGAADAVAGLLHTVRLIYGVEAEVLRVEPRGRVVLVGNQIREKDDG